jgi:hypothetical protein
MKFEAMDNATLEERLLENDAQRDYLGRIAGRWMKAMWLMTVVTIAGNFLDPDLALLWLAALGCQLVCTLVFIVISTRLISITKENIRILDVQIQRTEQRIADLGSKQ